MQLSRGSASETVRDSHGVQKRILIIDDDADSRWLVKTILEMEDYLTLIANGGKAGLKLLTEVEKPDLILLDVQMTGMTGIEFLKVLEQMHPLILEEVPIVFLTGLKEIPDSRAMGFIRKPIMIDSFLTEVRRYIGEDTKFQIGPGSL